MGDSIKEQVRRSLVAIISLIVALLGLAYNSWHNEKSELNSNIRTAGFEILLEIGELQRVVFFSHYDRDTQLRNPRAGWVHVLTIRYLSQVMPEPVPAQALQMKTAWEGHWSQLGESDTSVNTIISPSMPIVLPYWVCCEVCADEYLLRASL